MILVDDDSRTDAWSVIEQLTAAKPWIRSFRLMRNDERKQAREASAGTSTSPPDAPGDEAAVGDESAPGVADVEALEQRWQAARQELDLLLRRRQTVDEVRCRVSGDGRRVRRRQTRLDSLLIPRSRRAALRARLISPSAE